MAVTTVLLPLQFRRQYAVPLDADQVFETTAARTAYLTNPRRFAGMIASDLEAENAYMLNAARNAWITFGSSGASIITSDIAYVDQSGNDISGTINDPSKPFETIQAAIDTLPSTGGVIEIGVGRFTSPNIKQELEGVWFKGSGKPKPNWTVAVPSVDGDTKTAPTALEGGTILEGSFWFASVHCQNIIVTDLGVDVGSDWCTVNNGGNSAEGLIFASDYTPGGGNSADGGHFLQSGVTPLQGLVIRNVAVLCKNAVSAVHAALFENCFAPDISGVSTYFGAHGIVFKTIGGVASHLEAFGHSFNGIIIKSNDYANCYRLSVSNFNIGSIGAFDGGGLRLDANDGGSPGLYFCNINNGNINKTTYGIQIQGSSIDAISIGNITINVTSGNAVDVLSGLYYSNLQNIATRTCGGIGFNIAAGNPGIILSNCSAIDNSSDGFRFTGVNNLNFDNINAILNDGYGINIVSGTVHGGVKYTESNVSGAINGTFTSKLNGSGINDIIEFTAGDVGYPAVEATTYVLSVFVNRKVLVTRNGIPQRGVDPGDGSSYITKSLGSNTLTFSPALISTDYIQIIVITP